MVSDTNHSNSNRKIFQIDIKKMQDGDILTQDNLNNDEICELKYTGNHSNNIDFNHNNSTTNVFNHSNNHNVTKYICHYPDCFKEYKSKYNLRKHIIAHEGGLNYECTHDGCSKRYKIKENLDLHFKNFHLKEKPFKCGFCSKRFSHRNGRLYHEKKKHLNILEFKCEKVDCQAAYASRSALKYHVTHKHDNNN